MRLRICLGGLLLLGALQQGAADERPRPSIEEDGKSLAGRWEPIAAKGAGKVTLEFEQLKGKKELFLTARVYNIRLKPAELVDLDSSRIKVLDEHDKRFLLRKATKIFYTLKADRLILDGEYEAGGTMYLLTGEYMRIQAK
jgi:hypothetical protein